MMTDDGKSGVTGKGPSAECDVSHFTTSRFPIIRWAVIYLKPSCEDTLFIRAEIKQRNDQTLQRDFHTTVCNTQRHANTLK